MDALQDPAVDISLKHAIKGAQHKIASGYLMAAHEPGLPAHERAVYVAMYRQARDLAAEDGTTPLCISNNELDYTEPATNGALRLSTTSGSSCAGISTTIHRPLPPQNAKILPIRLARI
jgi:hypothetical protein